jgi:hypothetical protein
MARDHRQYHQSSRSRTADLWRSGSLHFPTSRGKEFVMDRKGVWIVAAAIVVGATTFGLSQAIAQRDFRTEARPADGNFARYVVANVTEGEIIIMDVTTGDLYSAKPRDVKPYEARPRGSAGRFPQVDERKDGFRDEPFKDKGKGFKDEAVPPPADFKDKKG